jgi:hypothetical protein
MVTTGALMTPNLSPVSPQLSQERLIRQEGRIDMKVKTTVKAGRLAANHNIAMR